MARKSVSLELCPRCGDLVTPGYFNYNEGWCRACVKAENIHQLSKLESFLEQNADHLEYYLAQGLTLSKAIDKVRADVAPTCISCGGFIKRASRYAVFCRTNPTCKKRQKRYEYLVYRKGFSKAEALSEVIPKQ